MAVRRVKVPVKYINFDMKQDAAWVPWFVFQAVANDTNHTKYASIYKLVNGILVHVRDIPEIYGAPKIILHPDNTAIIVGPEHDASYIDIVDFPEWTAYQPFVG